MLDDLLMGQSPIEVDFCLAILFTIAGVVQWVQIAWNGPDKLHARYLIAFGWTLWATRMWIGLANGNDPFIPPVAAVAISFIACGNILRNLPRIRS